MRLTITQRGGDKSSHSVLEDAARYFVNELFDDQSQEKLTIKVRCVFTPKDFYGWHEVKKGVHCITLCRAMSLKDKISTLAHEIVHAYQLEQGYFEVKSWCWSCNTGVVIWYGTTYKVDDNLPYERHPWEIEAHMMEKRIINKYYKAHKIS